MSDLGRTTPDDENLDDLHIQASGWIEHRDFAGWTDDDKARFEAWLSESSAHRIAFLRADAGWQRTEMLAALRPFRPIQSSASPSSLGRRWPFFKIAAAVFVFGLLGVASKTHLATPYYATYTTPIGGHKTLTLTDGSEIELNTDTVIRLAKDGDQRTAWLDRGEAYFQIKHDAAHPFVVTAGNRRVTDLGTKFLIRQHSNDIKVVLVEGLARFDDDTKAGKARELTLLPGDVVVASAESLSVTKKSADDLANELGWRRGILVFNQISLADAANELNRYNQKKLVVADAVAGRVNIGGTFRTNDIQAIANAAREAFGLHVEDRGSEIVISH